MNKEQLIDAYSLLASSNNLTQVRNNVFVNTAGVEFYLDKYGFHTITKYNNTTVVRLIEKLQHYNTTAKNLSVFAEVVGKKSKTRIRQILSIKTLTSDEKLNLIWKYIDTPVEEIARIIDQALLIEDKFKVKP